ncbi:MAG: biotin--[acetyl-CoA-carboxylase] ligase [Chitinophagia bacterium]
MLPAHVKSTIGHPFVVLPEIDSTNRYAKNQVQSKLAEHGAAYFALNQQEGKGRQGKKWISETGKNILLSIVINTSRHKTGSLPELNQWVAVACFDFFRKYAGQETRIKWPNDLYWRDRKAGGILIENSWRGESWQWAIIGIGININQELFDSGSGNPISLRQITGKTYDPIALAKELCQILSFRYGQWESNQQIAILATYNEHLYKQNEWVRLNVQGKEISAIPIRVTEQGALMIQTPDGEKQFLSQAIWL